MTNEHGLDIVHDPYSNELRVCGSLPTDPHLMNSVPIYTDNLDQLEEFELALSSGFVKDQNGKGACNGHSLALGTEFARLVDGAPNEKLSAWYPYAIMCQGIDQGSNILDAFRLIQDRGIPREIDFPYGVIDPTIITESIDAIAKRFRAELGARIEDFPGILSAVARLQPVNFSLRAGPEFNNLDEEGVPGYTPGPCNHAVCAFGGLKFSKKHGWLFKVWNSWNKNWGWNGCCWVGEKFHAQYFEAYMISAMFNDPEDNTAPPNERQVA